MSRPGLAARIPCGGERPDAAMSWVKDSAIGLCHSAGLYGSRLKGVGRFDSQGKSGRAPIAAAGSLSVSYDVWNYSPSASSAQRIWDLQVNVTSYNAWHLALTWALAPLGHA